MNDQELSNLINIRDFANRNFDNINFRLSNDEVRALRSKIVSMDKVILNSLLTFDPNKMSKKMESLDEPGNKQIASDAKSSTKVEKMKVRRIENPEA